jgi:hypothetical protein
VKVNSINFSLEELEGGKILSVPEDSSYIVRTANELRKKKLIDFEIEDLRLMIGQNISLNYLLPLAIDVLNKDILAEGDFYPGDLLKNVLDVDESVWKVNNQLFREIKELLLNNIDRINGSETIDSVKISVSRFTNLDS